MERLFGSFSFNKPLRIKITIFRKITAPVSLFDNRFLQFYQYSSPTNEGLTLSFNFPGGTPTSFCRLENLRFQLLTVVDVCVPYLCAYLPTSSFTFESKSIWYFFFSLHEFFNSVLVADTSAIYYNNIRCLK